MGEGSGRAERFAAVDGVQLCKHTCARGDPSWCLHDGSTHPEKGCTLCKLVLQCTVIRWWLNGQAA